MLAQFSRSGLIQDVANRLTAAFAQNLEGSTCGRRGPSAVRAGSGGRVDAASLVWSVLKERARSLVRALLGRKTRDEPAKRLSY